MDADAPTPDAGSTPAARPRTEPRALRAEPDAPLTVVDLTGGEPVPYERAWAWQRDLVARRAAGDVGDTVLLLEHPPTYTMGKQADRANVRYDDATLAERGIEVVDVDRGGDVTYHGPGQLVGYPIVQLAGPRVVDHVRVLEQLNIDLLAEHGLEGTRIPDYTGVWVGSAKVTAIGVRVSSGWVTQHGWATNVAPDMDDWAGIVACGIADEDKTVGSLAGLGVATSVTAEATRTSRLLAALYGAEVVPATPAALGLDRDG
ncbi:MAG: lipoyl(octanoyl) transferase LipB [Actinomycetes bacterium]